MSDSEFDTALRDYARGAAGIDALLAAFDDARASAAEDALAVAGLLEAAAGAGIDAAALARMRDRAGIPAADEEADRTRIISGGTGGKAHGRASGAPAPPADPADAETAADRTRILPGGTGGGAAPGSTGDHTDDDATIMRPGPAAGLPGDAPPEVSPDDATVLRAPAAAGTEDATRVGDADPDDATVVQSGAGPPGDDATIVQGGAEGPGDDAFFDPSAPTGTSAGADQTVVQAGPDATSPTAATLLTGTGSGEPAPVFGPGFILKDRFRLIEPLGEGGMGVVWKAADQLKEEARDRNPFVAVKLLQGDFKEHPEAFIALQREAAKQQRLAHPNIATVFDFDRDGDTVYMTMEVMNGSPMDKFVRKLPADGLPYEEALPIVEELGAGLAYAHQAGLVHSDLKPGNAFLTEGNHVKLLDFGIARASKTKTDAEGEKTLFDPGELGALTPTYATIEMFEGMDPDPRDDIYALAIIAYQLLTGKHPYGKKPAPKALELGLTPEPIAKLTKRQNQALVRGLMLKRDDRTPSVEEFLEGLRPYKSPLPWIIGGSLAAAIVIGVLAWKPFTEYLVTRENEQIIEVFMRGDQASIDAAMAMVAELEDPAQRETVAADPRTRKAIIDLHVARARAAFEPETGRYDYASAVAVLEELTRLYPDSAEILTLRTELRSERDRTLASLAERYTALRDEGRLVPDPEADDITDVHAIVRQIDPEHGLLTDPKLPGRFAEVARAALDGGEYERAREVLVASESLAPGDAGLATLREETESELARVRDERRVAELEGGIGERWRSFASLDDFEGLRAELLELADLSPAHPLLARAGSALEKVFAGEFSRLLDAGQPAPAAARLLAFAPLLDMERVRADRAALTASGFGSGDAPAVAQRRERIEALLAAPGDYAPRWEYRLRAAYRELLALVPPDDAGLGALRGRVVRLYLSRAEEARAEERFEAGLALVAGAALFAPDSAAVGEERRATLAAQDDKRRREEEARRLARIEKLRNTLLADAGAGRADEARAVLGELAAELPADDEFLVRTAPEAIAAAYLGLSEAATAREDREGALALARRGLEVKPGDPALEAARAEHGAAVTARALALTRRRPGTSPALARVPPAFVRPTDGRGPPAAHPQAGAGAEPLPIAPGTPGYPALGPALAGEIAERIETRASAALGSGEPDRALAALVSGAALAPGVERLAALRERAETEVARVRDERRVAELERRLGERWRSFVSLDDFAGARAELLELRELSPGHPLLDRTGPALDEIFAGEFAGLLADGRTSDAAARLAEFASLLELERVRGFRGALDGAGLAGADAAAAADRRARIEALLAATGDRGPRWEQDLSIAFRELTALLPGDDPALAALGERVVRLYLDRAEAARAGERFEAGLSLVERAAVFAPGSAAVATEREATLTAQADKRRREEEARRLARIETLRGTLLGHAGADRVDEARAVLEELRAELPADDEFLARTGPGAIAQAYLRLAAAAAAREDREGALALARRGLDVRPGDAALEAASAEHRAAVVARALAFSRRRPGTAPALDLALDMDLAVAPAPRPVTANGHARAMAGPGTGAGEAPPAATTATAFPALGPAIAGRIADRIAAGARGSAREVAALARPAAGFRALHPERYPDLEKQLAGTLGARLDELAKSKDVKNHNNLLDAAQRLALLRGRAPIEGPKPSKLIAGDGMRDIEGGKLIAAAAIADRVAKEQSDATNLDDFRAEIARRRAQAEDNYAKFEQNYKARRLREARQYLDRTLALWSDRKEFHASLKKLDNAAAVRKGACVESLAGYGRSRRGICRDEVGGRKGPMMVVVPAGDAIAAAFAIGKYEVSIGEFNEFCKASGACKTVQGDSDLPATRIPIDTARAYAKWLSAEADAVYRLPTEKEWEYAALAGGKQPRKDFNCRVTQGGQVVKGHSLVKATSGQQNGWGLANYVGNAREWVEVGGALKARGGAFSDSLIDCDVGLTAPHDGSPDELTGFRLVRELG